MDNLDDPMVWWLAGGAIVAALLILGVRGWQRRKEEQERLRREQERLAAEAAARAAAEHRDREAIEAARNARPPAGGVTMSTPATAQAGADRSGRIMLILVGTFAENVSQNLLALLDRSGLGEAIGSILLIELDRACREQFLSKVPAVYLDRIVTVAFSGRGGGWGNAPPEEVLTSINRWGPPVLRGAQDVCELHQRLHQGDEAALGLVFISQGGHAIIGTKAVETVKSLFTGMTFYGITALPVDDRLRVRVVGVLEAYRQVGLRGTVAADNLTDEVRNDLGVVASVAAVTAAAEHSDAAVQLNNALHLLFEESPGGLVSFSTYAHQIPAYPITPTHPTVPLRYFVYKDSVDSSIHNGLDAVDQASYWALQGSGWESRVPLTSRFDVALIAVIPEHLKQDEDSIVQGQYLKGLDKRNYHLLVAPMATVVDPQRPLCPVVVVSLRAVAQPQATLKELTTPLSSPQLPLASTNGARMPETKGA